MTKQNTKVVRDPIHGLIPLYPDEIQLVNTKAFQRLRRIRQLAMCYLVYPGAVHTRFDHSIGTMHVAGLICNKLIDSGKMNEAECRAIRKAALLHDIGHGPYSHVSEYLLTRYYDKKEVADVGVTPKIHEKVTSDIISTNDEISAILPEEDRRKICSILDGGKSASVEHSIVSSSLDADKMDYLLRDSHFVGVNYGRFDLSKVIEECRKLEKGTESWLAVDIDGLFAVEQLVLAKLHMTQQVYAHRVRSITDSMIVRGLTLAIDGGDKKIRAVYSYDGSKEFADHYLEYDDEVLMRAVLESSVSKASEIFARLRDRRLYRQICKFDLVKVDDALQRSALSKMNSEDELRMKMEKEVADELRIEPDCVIVELTDIKNPTYRSAGTDVNYEEILFINEDGTSSQIQDIRGGVVYHNTSSPTFQNVQVYCPRDRWTANPKRAEQRERDNTQKIVRSLILSTANLA